MMECDIIFWKSLEQTRCRMELHDPAIQDTEYAEQVEVDPLTEYKRIYSIQCQHI